MKDLKIENINRLGLPLFILGGVALLNELGFVPDQAWAYTWPIIFVVVGLYSMTEENIKAKTPSKKQKTRVKK